MQQPRNPIGQGATATTAYRGEASSRQEGSSRRRWECGGELLAPVMHSILSFFGSTVNKRWNRKEFGNVVFLWSGNGARGWVRRPWEWNWAAEEPRKAGRRTDGRRTEAVRRMEAESGSPLNGVPRRRAPFALILAPRRDGGKKKDEECWDE